MGKMGGFGSFGDADDDDSNSMGGASGTPTAHDSMVPGYTANDGDGDDSFGDKSGMVAPPGKGR